MFPHIKGILITTDIPTKQLIVHLNQENQRKIILKDLDDTHVLVDAAYVEYIKSQVERIHEQHLYERK